MCLRVRFKLFFLIVAALLFAAGCERTDHALLTAETDDPGYRRAKDMLRQGRNREALSELINVIDRRGRAGSPESHLEIGLLYQQHIKDPIAAIYHFQKFRELAPNGPKSELVRQRIDAATREFARTLPATPMENNVERLDLSEVVQRQQREIDQLKADLMIARAAAADAAQRLGSAVTPDSATGTSLVTAVDVPNENVFVPSSPSVDQEPRLTTPWPGSSTTLTSPAPNRSPTPPPTPPATPGRKHIVTKGDTLSSISLKYYGNRSRWRDIRDANRALIGGGEEPRLSLGMELKIPQ